MKKIILIITICLFVLNCTKKIVEPDTVEMTGYLYRVLGGFTPPFQWALVLDVKTNNTWYRIEHGKTNFTNYIHSTVTIRGIISTKLYEDEDEDSYSPHKFLNDAVLVKVH